MANEVENVALQMYLRGKDDEGRHRVYSEIVQALAVAYKSIATIDPGLLEASECDPDECWDGMNCYPCYFDAAGSRQPFPQLPLGDRRPPLSQAKT